MPNPPDAPRFLFEGQDAFDALSASLADTVLILEPDGVVSYAAPGVVAILGITPQVLEGQPLLAFVHPEDRVRWLTAAKEMLRPGGWCFIVEWQTHETESGPPQNARIGAQELRQIAKDSGFRFQSSLNLNSDYYVATLING